MTFEERIKAALGEQLFTILSFQTLLEDANAKIKELTDSKEKEATTA